jgi:hypothetical protein
MTRKNIIIKGLLLMAFCLSAVFISGKAPADDEILLAQNASNRRDLNNLGVNLGNIVIDKKNGYSIRPPAAWWMDTRSKRFLVKFSEKSYEAFIIVDAVSTEDDVKIDRDFKKWVNEKNREVKKTMGSYSVLSNKSINVQGRSWYRTEATFKAGANQVLMNVYYVSGNKKIFMITTMCPELTSAQKWDKLLESSVSTFSVL